MERNRTTRGEADALARTIAQTGPRAGHTPRGAHAGRAAGGLHGAAARADRQRSQGLTPFAYYEVAESGHEIQNPTSAEKIRLLGERMRLGPESRVLDVASGRGGPALVLGAEFGCRLTCIERSPVFAAAAVERAEAAGLADLIEVVRADAREERFEAGAYDAALCLGASFVWDGLAGTLRALLPTVRAGGHVAVGEPYWRSWPLPSGVEDEGYLPLFETVGRFEESGAPVVSLIDSSQDDWDRYEVLHWQACEEWLAANGADPLAEEICTAYRHWKENYLATTRDLLGWAILVGLRPPA